MSESDRALLEQTVTAVLADACPEAVVRAAERGDWPARAWELLATSGLTLVGIPEAAGGSGGSVHDLGVVLRAVGRAAAPVPVAENWLACWLRAAVALPSPEGPSTIGWGHGVPANGGIHLVGMARAVPWLLEAEEVVVLAASEAGTHHVVTGTVADDAVTRTLNLAGEPRDSLDLSAVAAARVVAAPPAVDLAGLRLLGAFTRAVLTVGALDRALELTLRYSAERSQFGRPLARFQAVAQMTAVLVCEVEAAAAAVAVATDALDPLADVHAAAAEIGVAKVRTARAARAATAIAHQVHGAIGWTEEYPLQLVTRRALAWRDEFGSERDWALALGAQFATIPEGSLWDGVVPT
jgi:acyl-CoA dehydrogenase